MIWPEGKIEVWAMAQASDEHVSLSPVAARLGHAFARSKALAVACIVVIAVVGWIYLALIIARMADSGQVGALGPGMGLFDLLWRGGSPDPLGRALLDAP